MRAALIEALGAPPRLAEAPEPEGALLVDVECAPINPIDVAIGAGRHYSGSPETPYVPGAEAVGRRADTGERVWVHGRRTGGMAERLTAPPDAMIAVPDDADPALAGACGIAGMAGWLPVIWRAPVREGDRVLVLGATGTAGQFALQGAKLRGAYVIAAGRDPEGLERAKRLGADELVPLDALDQLRELTYVFDPLWGEPLAAAVAVCARGACIVHVGQSADGEAILSSAAVRGKGIELYGYSNFLVPPEVLEREYRALVEHVTRGEVHVDVESVPFEEVEDAWERQASGAARRKLVLTLF